MKNYAILVSSLVLFYSCSESKETDSQQVIPTVTDEQKVSIEFPQMSEIDSSGVIMMPLRIGNTINNSKISGSFDSKKEDYFWNIVFVDTNTNDKYPLSTDKLLISNYDSDYGSSYSASNESSVKVDTSTKKYLFYRIRSFDANKNGNLDLSDPEYLFISDRNGKNLKQISVPNTHLSDWIYVGKTNKVYFTALADTNNDKAFDENDELVNYEYDLQTHQKSEPFFNSNFKNSLKENFKKHWLK